MGTGFCLTFFFTVPNLVMATRPSAWMQEQRPWHRLRTCIVAGNGVGGRPGGRRVGRGEGRGRVQHCTVQHGQGEEQHDGGREGGLGSKLTCFSGGLSATSWARTAR